jgi:predicted secreted hydrolase
MSSRSLTRGPELPGPALRILALLALALAGCQEREGGEVRASLSPAEALAGADTVGYERARAPRPFTFPRDHGPHPEYRTEWWYLTGNLRTPEGRRLAYHLTFFRNSLAPEPAVRRSAWNTNQLWMGHLAITDVEEGRHRQAERLARGAAGIAGGRVEPFRVWLDGWELVGTPEGTGAGGVFPLRARAREAGWGLDLTLDQGKPPVLQGQDGWSRKGPEDGNASYYFSLTRMPTRGVIELDGQAFPVEGESWMDREWSTSALSEEHVGWDWFSLQLSDGREVMFFELRRRDGDPEPLNHGVVVAVDGSSRSLSAGDWDLRVLERWSSTVDGTEYPSGWSVRFPDAALELEIRPKVADQEMNVSFRYWEGAVEVRGTGPDGPLEGHGFVELTGYADAAGVR